MTMARAKQKTRAAAKRGVSRTAKTAGRATKATKAKKTVRSRAADRQNRWSAQEDRQLRTMVKQGYSIRDAVAALGRTESAVRQHVYKLGLVLRGRKRRK
jgi:type II secretory pathway component PulF